MNTDLAPEPSHKECLYCGGPIIESEWDNYCSHICRQADESFSVWLAQTAYKHKSDELRECLWQLLFKRIGESIIIPKADIRGAGANYLASVALEKPAVICPPCKRADHWNHRAADGSCITTENISKKDCECPIRSHIHTWKIRARQKYCMYCREKG